MYRYEHINGKIIDFPDVVVDPIGPSDYFASPFVVRWWHVPDDMIEAYREKDI